jgi:5-methylcytosine-specific restriction endonuclease McrA
MSIPDSLRQQVIEQAKYRCEYCRTFSRLTGMPLVMEHILPKSMGGPDSRENLAASCYRCKDVALEQILDTLLDSFHILKLNIVSSTADCLCWFTCGLKILPWSIA